MALNNKYFNLIFLIFNFIFPKFSSLFNSPPSDLLPCQFPSSNPLELATFCQLPYHQVPLICDPGGILSRTEAELIDRQLKTQVFNNLTSCICPLRPCIQKDKKMGQLRVFGLLVPTANGNSLINCLNNSKNQRKNNKNLNNTINEFNRLTGLFARLSLDRLLTGFGVDTRERCDPDLFILYVDSWWVNQKHSREPFIARIFRRNLANLRDYSLVERVNGKGSPFEIMNDYLLKSLLISKQQIFNNEIPPKPTENTKNTKIKSEEESELTVKKGHSIPLWAIFSALILVLMALFALLLAHLVGRRVALAQQQKKFSSASRMSMRSARPDESLLMSGGGGASATTKNTQNNVSAGGGNSASGGGLPSSHLKSQMMFRQFGRKCQSTTNSGGGQANIVRQKI
uniref:Uncharacterized protein n=2 Tax=Meloidogyne enterolobii TaxID=390850 RepID=A0A6V7X7T8_MELEN|nr:unnamed protein product [Meloidogyne enterolobii]